MTKYKRADHVSESNVVVTALCSWTNLFIYLFYVVFKNAASNSECKPSNGCHNREL